MNSLSKPQLVNIGSATPTYFHVAYGDMRFPEILIKLTYWTTYIYPNWQNAVRIPHVLKMAEKLSSMTASDKLYEKGIFTNFCDPLIFSIKGENLFWEYI